MIEQIFDAIEAKGGKVYYVGGFVRSNVLNTQNNDFDIEVHGLSQLAIAQILNQFGKVDTVGQRFGVTKLVTRDGDFDFSVPRLENKVGVGRAGFDVNFPVDITREQAARRRDFTMNSMCMERDGKIYDPFDGQGDLSKRILRHTSSAFTEDPTRVLRGFRFCGQLNLRAAKETAKLCRSIFDQHDEIEHDMVWSEWKKWATRSIKPSAGLAFLWSSGWIHHYPELYHMTRCHQEPEWHPEGSAWQHTKHVVDAMNLICARDELTEDSTIVHMFGALLHDCGKPLTTTVNDKGRIVSPGHDEAGVPLAYSFMERIHMPLRYRDAVADIVRFHMRHIFQPTQRSAKRFAYKLKNISVSDWLRIVEADHSGRPPLEPGVPESAKQLFNMMIDAMVDNTVQPIIKGRDLIKCGFTPSPLFGKVLSETHEFQLDNDATYEELLSIAIEKMKQVI